MKKAFAIIILLSLLLNGCSTIVDVNSQTEDSSPSSSFPTLSIEETEVLDEVDNLPTTMCTENSTIPTWAETIITEKESQKHDDASTEPTGLAATEAPPSAPDTTNDSRQPTIDIPNPETDSTEPGPVHSNQTSVESQPTPIEPSLSEPAPTVPVPTEPPTTGPTDTSTAEPTGCSHDWVCIQHSEEGHWKAGIVCDCGWVIYGSPDEVVAVWNSHSASFPPEESLFEHGGFGCVDEWVVDAPAYEEWYCSLCGEAKP